MNVREYIKNQEEEGATESVLEHRHLSGGTHFNPL
jgi:hypothetical protein